MIKILQISMLLIALIFTPFLAIAHGSDHSQEGKKWSLKNNTQVLEAHYISFSDELVYLKDSKSNAILKFPITDFSMEDQLLILRQSEMSEKINLHHSKVIHLEATSTTKKISKAKAAIALVVLLLMFVSIALYFSFSKIRKPAIVSLFCSFFVFAIIACSAEEEELPEELVTVTPPAPPETDTDTSTDTNTSTVSDTTTDTSTDSNTNDESSSSEESSAIESIKKHFEEFTGVTITNDEDFFYINSYSWPEHSMGVCITSWQEQVPIPQNYTGSNSWVIPLNPKKAQTPLSTEDHLLKGALAVAINGVPIFNVYNNRGENAYEIGELDNWGGHFGRGDDYHYHLIPTHLEEIVGTDQPLAYALDGYPVYGYTEETLDEAFGYEDSNGNYRYHANTASPYFMPYVVGEITLDPDSTAPEDQIYPQPVQNPIRPSNNFKPVNGAAVTAFTQTGTNAFSFEYTVSGKKYYVNYSWDDNCKFTYTYVDENGGTTNLPTYGAITDSSQNIEVYTNVSFCQDVNLGEATYTNSTDDTNSSTNNTDEDLTTETGDTTTDSSATGFSATSENSNFTLSSSAIDSSGALLDAYKCEQKVNGVEKSIPMSWSNIPAGTGKIAISIHGYPNPSETNSYLTLWDIDPSVTEIAYGGANDGDWFIGPNKDGASLSYTSLCSPNGATSTYYMTIYALSETPPSLLAKSASEHIEIDYLTLIGYFDEVTILDKVELEYIATSL